MNLTISSNYFILYISNNSILYIFFLFSYRRVKMLIIIVHLITYKRYNNFFSIFARRRDRIFPYNL